MIKINQQNVSVIGLGNLGLPLAVTFALSEFTITAMDIDEGRIELIKKGVAPFEETGLLDALQDPKVENNLYPTTDYKKAIVNNQASFIVVNTPSEADGSFNIKNLRVVAENIGKELRTIDDFHVVVVVSTVSPNDCESYIIPILEANSGKKCGVDFGFVHNPEFVALGSVINDMLNPDFRVIGESDSRSGKIVEQIYKQVSHDPIIRMNITNAEFTKIALNCYMTMKISFTNTLAEICQKLKGGNVDLITKTLGYDNRISPKFLRAGLGFGGPCFPRDNKAFIAIANRLGTQAYLSEAIIKVNDQQVPLAIERIKTVPKVKTITVLGLSYKPNVSYIIESQALQITQLLAEDSDYQVTVYDPQAMELTEKILGNKVEYASSLDDALKRHDDLIVILTPWKEFEELNLKGRKVINFWKAD